jgi:hypothetical protein
MRIGGRRQARYQHRVVVDEADHQRAGRHVEGRACRQRGIGCRRETPEVLVQAVAPALARRIGNQQVVVRVDIRRRPDHDAARARRFFDLGRHALDVGRLLVVVDRVFRALQKRPCAMDIDRRIRGILSANAAHVVDVLAHRKHPEQRRRHDEDGQQRDDRSEVQTALPARVPREHREALCERFLRPVEQILHVVASLRCERRVESAVIRAVHGRRREPLVHPTFADTRALPQQCKGEAGVQPVYAEFGPFSAAADPLEDGTRRRHAGRRAELCVIGPIPHYLRQIPG